MNVGYDMRRHVAFQDNIQERSTILISFCFKFIGVHICQKLPT